MIIVSDTTPIISFLKIGLLDLLEELYGEVIIPEAVYKELLSNPQMIAEVEIIKSCSFLKIKHIKNEFAVKLLQKQMNLGIGESEAIVLADALHADLIIIDERKARGIAKNMSLNVTGTLGILVDAKSKGKLKEIKPLLDELIKSNIRISAKLYKDILELVNESYS
jgi:predicted nucleic acid-binding protein